MSVDFQRFLEWAESRFGEIEVKGNEIRVNSIFAEDYKKHMWCNPYGGKQGRPHGVYHCWKTDEKGSLVTLVMKVDNCTYEEALEILDGADTRLSELERKVQEIFESRQQQPIVKSDLVLPPHTYLLDDLPSYNGYRQAAVNCLRDRKIPTEGLAVCIAGTFRNRIVIPYYDRQGKLIYFNCRDLGGSEVKYMGPPKDAGVGKGDVIYFYRWPSPGSRVYFTEGEFDSISILLSGLPSGAFGGKALTETQIEIIRINDFKPVICVDTDKAGKQALAKIGEQFSREGFEEIGFVRPPTNFKDWNLLLQQKGPKIVRKYIELNTKTYGGSHGAVSGEWTTLQLKLQDL